MIDVEGLVVRYGQAVGVADVGLKIQSGATVGLIGPNGSGKSTVVRAMFGAVERLRGTVVVDGAHLEALSARDRAERVAVVAQEERTGLPLTVWDSVILGRSIRLSGWRHYRPEDEVAAAQAMSHAGVAHLAQRSVDTLSGGERQRVLIARAITQGATHLLLDEPTNHLDIRYQHEILALVRNLPLTTLIVLHDLNLAARYCDELVLLDQGRVVAVGTPDEILMPDLIASTYGIGARRADAEGVVQLTFFPLSGANTSSPFTPHPGTPDTQPTPPARTAPAARSPR